jgi:hypothetical protein
MPKPSEKSPPLRHKPGFAPWVDDPDEPDDMTSEESAKAAEAAIAYMRKKRGDAKTDK